MTSNRFFRLVPALALALSLSPGAAAQTAPTAASAPTVEVYTIDPDHSSAEFKIKHMYVSTVTGRFQRMRGSISLDRANIEKSSAEVTIEVDSLDTAQKMRDKDLLGPNYFDAAKFPAITFTSSAVKDLGNGNLEVAGMLTLHGVTRPVTIAVSGWTTAPGMKPGTFLAGFGEGTTKFKRSDFGLTHLMGPIGDDVAIILSVEANRTQTAQ